MNVEYSMVLGTHLHFRKAICIYKSHQSSSDLKYELYSLFCRLSIVCFYVKLLAAAYVNLLLQLCN